MTSFLTPGLDMPQALASTARAGFAYLPSALRAQACDRLGSKLAGWPLEKAPVQVGSVRQHADMAAIGIDRWKSIGDIDRLASEIKSALDGSGWIPNEATLMSYAGPEAGISPHRDHRRFGLFIAVMSLAGQGRLTILGDRAGERVLADFSCCPGDLVLLRGVGLAEPADGSDPRPLHAVSGPSRGSRISLTFRMDTEVAA